jgi:hypothetical protein
MALKRPLLTALFFCFSFLGLHFGAFAQPFALPTPNRDILDPSTLENYFVPTVGRTWESGTFGCVRSERQQIHEGLDIRSKTFDRRGEATDPVFATADGRIVYVNGSPGKSSYGRYIVIEHDINGIAIYSLYAHLSTISQGIAAGVAVKQNQQIGVIGRSTNTKATISKERAHLHFELCLYLSPHFLPWYRKNYPNQADHDGYHGWNLAGIDPWLVFKEQWKKEAEFDLASFIRRDGNITRMDKEQLCRVLIYKKEFPFARLYPRLTVVNKVALEEGIVAWDVRFDYNGAPFVVIPRAASEISNSKGKYTLLAVNEEEQRINPGRHFLKKTGAQWQMTSKFISYLDQITYIP